MDFFFDYSCPYAYLAFTQLERFERASGTRVRLKPMLLGGVFAARETPQNLMEVLGPTKAAHNHEDTHRWAAVFEVPLRMPPEHPRRTVEALRATLVTNVDRKVVEGFYRAYWVEGRAPSAEETVRDIVARAGHDPDRVIARIGAPEVKAALRTATDGAIAHGIFGAPSFVKDGELYWGQDRMHFAFGVPYREALPNRGPMTNSRPHSLELYWDFSSPYAYLASTQAEALAARTGAALQWRPMLLGGLFKAVGQVDVPLLAFSEAKRRYMLLDLDRWASHWKVPFRFPTTFPVNTVKALRIFLALPEERRSAFRAAAFRALWAEDRNIADDAVLRELIGPDAEAVLARTQDPAIKQALFDATSRAASAGVFGAPTWIVDEKELFWGQDRIDLVERALSG